MIYPRENHGDPFKLLGCTIDVDFRMHTCIDQLLARSRPESAAILRTRAYYSRSELIGQYKTHIWSLVEMHCGAYFHAATTLLDQVGQVQRSFLHSLGVSESQAFLDHNFAPCSLRRNIAVLGLLHKRVLGQCHPSFERLLPWCDPITGRGFGHNKQLYGHWLEATQQRALYDKSIFAMVNIYSNFFFVVYATLQ